MLFRSKILGNTICENGAIDTKNTKDAIPVDDIFQMNYVSTVENGNCGCTQTDQDIDSDISPCEPVTQCTRFGFRDVRCILPNDEDYEADDSSLSENSPSVENRDSFSSCNDEENQVFSFPGKSRRQRRYPKEKHPRFKNLLMRKDECRLACRQESNMTDSGISTSSYTDLFPDIETLETHL